jgi:hypothetical protein
MTTLYIIGNGFDLHHSLPTSFNEFKAFTKHSTFANAFERYFDFELKDGSLKDIWSNLENHLSKFSIDKLIEHKRDYEDEDPHEDQFNYEVEVEIDNLTQELVILLSKYLSIADERPVEPCTLLNIDRECRFINFNYTHTLERIYSISPSNICHIHGMLDNNAAPLVIGHGLECSEYVAPKQVDVSHYTEEQISVLCDDSSVKYEEATESAHRYYNLSFKDTQSCIAQHLNFLSSLHDVDRIIILGHSLNKIDAPYFDYLKGMVKRDCLWKASFYPDNERENKWNNLKHIVNDISRIELFKMSDLTLNKIATDFND